MDHAICHAGRLAGLAGRPPYPGVAAQFSRGVTLVAVLLTLCLVAVAPVRAQDPTLRFGGQIPPEVETMYERGLNWLKDAQSAEGNWKDNQEGCGVDGICLMAFLASGDDPNYGTHAQLIRRGIRSIIKRQDATTGYFPSSMYHHGFAMLALSEAYGAVDEALLWEGEKPVRTIGKSLSLAIALSTNAQKKNKMGGWRYSPDAQDSDTSVTGAVLMGLFAARNAGLAVPDSVVNTALEYIRRSTGRDGAVAYAGGLGGMGGSMNLTAIAVLTGAIGKTKDVEQYKAALKRLQDNLEHREAGTYAEYFRYYMAQALFQGDYDSWQKWNAAKVRELRDQQRENGSFGGAYNTGMTLLGLAVNYRFLPIYER